MLKFWEIVKFFFLVAVALALLYAYAYGQEFQFPKELAFLKEADLVQVSGCVKSTTGERAVCIIFRLEDKFYLMVVDPDTKAVKEAFQRDENGFTQIYPVLKSTWLPKAWAVPQNSPLF
jgi:hypothetical protein